MDRRTFVKSTCWGTAGIFLDAVEGSWSRLRAMRCKLSISCRSKFLRLTRERRMAHTTLWLDGDCSYFKLERQLLGL